MDRGSYPKYLPELNPQWALDTSTIKKFGNVASEAPAPVQQDVPQPAPANDAPAVEPTPRSDREDYGEVVELRATYQKPLFQSELAFLPRAL
jgi:hypothetical protein